jgi:Tfp pilus assembly protein PilF
MKSQQFFRACAVLVAATALTVSPSYGQAEGGGNTGGGDTGGGGAAGGSTGRGSTTGGNTGTGNTRQDPMQQGQMPGQQQQTFPEMRRPIFLQGKVVFADGTPAPPSITIERFCSGMPIPEAYTDSKGRFSFEVGRNQAMIADASTSGFNTNPMGGDARFGGSGSGSGIGGPMNNTGVSERELNGCELRANLPGYRSSSVELTGRRMFDNPDVGQIILTKIGNVEGLTISMTSLEAPKDAKKAFTNGMKEAGKKKPKWDKAQADVQKAVELYPQYAEAWYALGQIYDGTQKPDEARQAYEKSISADPKFMKPYIKIAMMDAQASSWGDVATRTGTVLKMNPYDFPEAYFLNAMAHLNLNNLTTAEESAREAIKMKYNRQRPQVEQIMGMALALQNKYQEASEHLKMYLELSPEANNAPAVKQQLEQLEQFLAQQGGAPAPPQQ